MNRLQEQLLENTNHLPDNVLQELVDFSEFLQQKMKNKAFRERIDESEEDIKEGRVKTVIPDELFKEIGI